MDSSSFFPLQQEEEPFINCPELTIWDLGFDHIPLPEGSPRVVGGIDSGHNGKDRAPGELQDIEGGTANRDVQKKMMHREIERQRRQDMATLYASLRSVLPPNILKGKRSVSDQIHEATKHIKSLQGNIRDLESKRDGYKLKKSRPDELLQVFTKGSCNKTLPIVVTAEPCSVGIEVLISCDFMEEGLIALPLSRVLQLLLEEGLNAVTCNSTNHEGRLHYMIRCEVLGYSGVNLQLLRTKLISKVKNLVDIKL